MQKNEKEILIVYKKNPQKDPRLNGLSLVLMALFYYIGLIFRPESLSQTENYNKFLPLFWSILLILGLYRLLRYENEATIFDKSNKKISVLNRTMYFLISKKSVRDELLRQYDFSQVEKIVLHCSFVYGNWLSLHFTNKEKIAIAEDYLRKKLRQLANSTSSFVEAPIEEN